MVKMKTSILFFSLLVGSQLSAQILNLSSLRDSVLIPSHLSYKDTLLNLEKEIDKFAIFHYSFLHNPGNDTAFVICNYMLNESNLDYYFKNYYFFYNQDTIVTFLENVKEQNLDSFGIYKWTEKIKYLLKDHLFPTDRGAFTYSSHSLVITYVHGIPKEYKVYDRMEWVPQAGRVFRFGP